MTSVSREQYPVKVSVVLPTFNQSKYLGKAIQAILNQTFTDFELIVVNDGSTDGTADLLATLQHPKLRVITQNNQGLPRALNNGFAAAQGQYWTWTSTDNIVAPIWLEELVKALANSPADVGYAFSYYAGIDDNDNILFVNRDIRFDLPSLLLRHSGNASFLYRAELAKKVGLYDKSLFYAEDLDMWIRMAELTRAVQVESVLYYYRLHANSMTSQSEKVRKATQGVVAKYLAKTGGVFDIDRLFPSISLSADPAFERWKARIRLVTLGVGAMYYCPVDAMVDQVIKALHEKYDRGLVANIVHLYAKEQRWDTASTTVKAYRQSDSSEFLASLQDIVARRAGNELEKIPFMTIEEKHLACDCHGPWSQTQLLRNLSCVVTSATQNQSLSYEKLVIDLINKLEDQQDHPEIWEIIAKLQTQDEKKMLQELRLYLLELIKIPQDPQALILLKLLEAVSCAYSDNVELAKNKLQELYILHPYMLVIKGALNYINKDERIAKATLVSMA